MIRLMPPERLWEMLAEFQCHECLRQLQNHTPAERQTCHDHALSSVTLIEKGERHNL